MYEPGYASYITKEDILRFTVSDPILTHASLVYPSLNLNRIQGSEAFNDTYYHQGEAIRLLKERISSSEYRVASNAIIYAVTCLMYFEVGPLFLLVGLLLDIYAHRF